MARRRSIAPEDQVGYMIDDLKKGAKANNTKPSGSKHISAGNSISVENEDGTQTVIGGDGIQEFVGDTTIPPVPSAPVLTPGLGTLTVTWDGTFADSSATVPLDWSHIEVFANGIKVGDIRSATRASAPSFPVAIDTEVVVALVAVDKAGNRSEQSLSASVTVTGVDVDTSALEAELDALDERLLAAETGDIEAGRLTVTDPADFSEVFVQSLTARTADIQTVRVDNLLAGDGQMNTLAAGQVSANILNVGVETPDGGLNGVRFDNTGITAKDATGADTVRIGSDGSAFFKGTVAAGSIVSLGSVQGLDDKLTEFDGVKSTVESWATETDTTIIDGAKIATGSITAEKITLGSGENMIPGGYGEDTTGWVGWTITDIPESVQNAHWSGQKAPTKYYGLKNKEIGQSALFDISATSKFTPGVSFISEVAGQVFRFNVDYYDYSGAYLVGTGSTTTIPQADRHYRLRLDDVIPPDKAVTAQIRIEAHKDLTTYPVDKFIKFTAFHVVLGNELKLTSSGMSAFNNGEQTLRLNGEDNLIVGRYRTAPLGEPQILIQPTAGSYNGTQLAVWFTPDGGAPGFGSTTGPSAGLWMENIPNPGTAYPLSIRGQAGAGVNAYGPLKILPIGSGVPALLTTNGQNLQINAGGGNTTVGGSLLKLNGRADPSSTMIKAGRLAQSAIASGGFRDNIQITFPEAFPAGVNISIVINVVTTDIAEMSWSIRDVYPTGFTVLLKNNAPRSTGGLSIHWQAVQY